MIIDDIIVDVEMMIPVVEQDIRERHFMKRKTFEEFCKQAHAILGDDYIFYPPYKNMKTPIRYKHLVCGTSDTLIPSNIISSGASCKFCNEKEKAKNHRISEKEFKERLHKVRPTDDIELIEPLHGLFKKTKAKCLVCGYGADGKWTPLPINLLKGKGCPNCAGNAPKDFVTLQEEVKTLGKGEYKLLGTKRDKKDGAWLHLYHKVCGTDYWVRDYSFIAGYRCDHCKNLATGDRCRLSLDEVKEKISQVADHQYRYVRGKYKSNLSKLRVVHKKCGTEFTTTWAMLSRNSGLCPSCNASNGEQEVMGYLAERKIGYTYAYRIPNLKDQQNLHFDFWLPQCRVAIEYDGQQHYDPVKFGGISQENAEANFVRIQKHDQMKNQYCKEHNIELIRIPYNKKVKEVLDKQLLPELGRGIERNNITFKLISFQDAKPLMLKYHYLHRVIKASYNYGLFVNDQLMGMVAYTKPRVSLAQSISDQADINNTLELSRLYIKDEVSQTVPNITSEFVSWSLRQLKQIQNWFIISFADSGMHHVGAIYQATNFGYYGTTNTNNRYAWNGYGKHGGKWIKGHYYRYMILSSPKYRYIKAIGSKTFKKHAKASIKFDQQPYPKQDNQHYHIGDTEERLIQDRETGQVYQETELAHKLGQL